MTTVPLRRVASINPPCPEFERTPSDGEVTFMPLEAVWPNGRADVSRRAIKIDVATGYSRFDAGDILVPKVTPTFEAGRACRPTLATAAGSASTEVHVVRGEKVDPDYLTYVFQSRRFLTEGATTVEGVGNLRRVPAEWLANYPVWAPGQDEQHAVVDFLDNETAKIDALIARQVVLEAAIRERLRGVQDGLVSLSDVGVRFKYLVAEVDTRVGADWARLPLLSVSIHWGVRRRDEVTADLPRAEDLGNYKVVDAGDIVVNRMRAFQGALGRSPIEGIVSPDYLVLRPAATVDSDWLSASMRTPEFIGEMAARVRGIGSAELGTVRTPRINLADLGEIRLDLPTLTEQRTRYADRARSQSEASTLLESTGSLTDALRERRAALITAAVTGRLDPTTYGKGG